MNSSHTKAWLLLIGLAAFAVYAPSLGNGFAMDDVWVAKPYDAAGRPQALVGEVEPLRAYFSTNYHQVSGHSTELYRPVTILTYALVNHLQHPQMDPAWEAFPHHALNVLLHVVATMLTFWLVVEFGASRAGAIAAAAVFGLHGLHSEVVAGVVGRAELLGFVFGALGLLSYLRAQSRPPGRVVAAVALAAASATLLFLAFCSKESAVAWAGFVPVCAVLRSWQRDPACGLIASLRQQAWRCALIVAPPLLAFCWLRADMIAGLAESPLAIDYAANPLVRVDAVTRVLTAVALWGYGLSKVLLPLSLHADYGPGMFELVSSASDPRFLLAAVALIGLAGFGACSLRSRPLLALGAVVFLGFGLATSNVPFAIGTAFGERLYYTPSLALACAVAWLVQHTVRRGAAARAALAACLGLWLGWGAALIVDRNAVWADDETLFLHEAEHSPRSARMVLCAAGVRRARGELVAAERLARRATALAPEYALAWNLVGAIRLDQLRFEAAERALQRALAAAHEIPGAGAAMIHQNMGTALEGLGRAADARVAYSRAYRLAPAPELAAKVAGTLGTSVTPAPR